MFTHGSKKYNNMQTMGNKVIPSSFLGLKINPNTKTSSNIHSHTTSPYEQFQNSDQVLYHPTGLLKKHAPNNINTLERRSKK